MFIRCSEEFMQLHRIIIQPYKWQSDVIMHLDVLDLFSSVTLVGYREFSTDKPPTRFPRKIRGQNRDVMQTY